MRNQFGETINPNADPALAPAQCSADDIVLELKLPIRVTELVSVIDSICQIHGKNSVFMRQSGQILQLYKLRNEIPPNEKLGDSAPETLLSGKTETASRSWLKPDG